MARSDYDIINLSLKHELNEWLTERGYAGLADNRNRLAEVVTRKLQDSFYINGKRKANAVCNTCSLQTKLELLLN
ncbi:hypothetical protein ABV178_005048 [Escherichia coli]|uniref:hypothetical protein n=1 Tax=Escherichia coli TaxID=562 RepID=UPI0002BC7B10|nr:hypothetical protein [Escherichia coli]EEZ6075000.1 hypothetical protein [Escherichia coli O6]EAB0668747.1 hypothetical protein [Escherichia coli]EEW7009128.1 hypothetical protein [Escherichia coli]EFA6287109.1 hypothetical protein [Escherichia coli]EFJ0007228.1 hypothetical protein [Escherichia coli]